MSSSYFFMGSNLEKCGIFLKNGRFSGRIRPDWRNTSRADMAGLGSIGVRRKIYNHIKGHKILTTSNPEGVSFTVRIRLDTPKQCEVCDPCIQRPYIIETMHSYTLPM